MATVPRDVSTRPSVGTLLREWRERRRRSQLDLALDAEVSTRHLSCVETGRALPGRALLLRLAELLEVPLRERNALLLAAGYAPMFSALPLDDRRMAAVREAVQRVLDGHEPYPAIAVDRHWNLVLSNTAARRLLAGLPADLLAPPINVLRLSLDPRGMASHIVDLGSWREHLLSRLRRQVATSGDATLAALLAELAALPPLPGETAAHAHPDDEVVVRLRYRTPFGELALFSTITVFGTPVDVTVSELAVEAFFPADEVTAERLRAMSRAEG